MPRVEIIPQTKLNNSSNFQFMHRGEAVRKVIILTPCECEPINDFLSELIVQKTFRPFKLTPEYMTGRNGVSEF